jgi:6-phosphogluconolactonase/glucosamine-6-phosphate isomerase/deaminase
LSDERYGQVGHSDSNWHQLIETGFDFSGIKSLSILHGESLEKTITDYAAAIEPVLKSAEYVISQFGLGEDGHIAGILPRSPATTASGLVTGYVAQPFTRVSVTFDVLRKVDAAYGFVFGPSKGKALHTLDDEILSVVEQPAQILREIPEVYIYQDVVS